MEDDKVHNQQSANLHQQLFKKNPEEPLAEKINNNVLWIKTKQLPAKDEIEGRRWRWIGHTLQKTVSNTIRQALKCILKGGGRGQPKEHLATGSSSRCQETGIHLASDRPERKSPVTLKLPCRWPIPWEGCKAKANYWINQYVDALLMITEKLR